jgi:hypothetical protein
MMGSPAALNVTEPVAEDGETVAVKVIGCPIEAGLELEVSVVVVPVSAMVAEVLPA